MTLTLRYTDDHGPVNSFTGPMELNVLGVILPVDSLTEELIPWCHVVSIKGPRNSLPRNPHLHV